MSFFDQQYQTPAWLKAKLSRRHVLKSAAGATAIATLPRYAVASSQKLTKIMSSEPWLTLDSVLQHLLPQSNTGPGAKDIQATQYLYQAIQEQPIDEAEKKFVKQGVGWLNSYSQQQLSKNFTALTLKEKDRMLRAISGSTAGENWLNTLINYIYEAMLSPPSYGGNPNGIGWQWLNHQAGFPLPQAGKRYYEIPGRHKITIKNIRATPNTTAVPMPEEKTKS